MRINSDYSNCIEYLKFETWMQQYNKNRVKIGIYMSYEKYFDSVIKNRLGKQLITEIRGEHIQRLYNDLKKEGYAIASIKVVSAILNGSLQQAMRNGLIERNPVKLAELPRMGEKRYGRRWPGNSRICSWNMRRKAGCTICLQ